jgi:hypothetical protein
LFEAEKKVIPATDSAPATDHTATQVKSKKKSDKKSKKTKSTSTKRKNLHLEHKPSDETDLLIMTVNEGDFGFKVDTCKL